MTGASRERILIYRLGSLGDTVVALPCLHAVARAFPDAERVMLTNMPVSTKAAPLEAILGGSGLVQGYIAYPVGTRSFRALRALRRQLGGVGASTLVYLTPSRGLLSAWRDVLFFRLCGFRRLIGVPLSADLQHNRVDAEGVVEPECERLARCVAELGPIDLDDPANWALNLTEAERAEAATACAALGRAPRLSINMGGKVAKNDWGEANWRALVTALHQVCPDHALVFVGAAEDSVRAAGVGALWKGPVANLCGRVSPRVSAAAMSGSRAFVGHDSGPMHLAASVGVPCVGLFGNNNLPRKWHPHGAAHRVIHEMRGMAWIRVEQVVEALRATLSGAAVQGGAASPATPEASVDTDASS